VEHFTQDIEEFWQEVIAADAGVVPERAVAGVE